MTFKQFALLLLLAFLWGISFIFMRVAAPEFGPFALVTFRVFFASLLLFAVIIYQKKLAIICTHWKKLLLAGITSTAIPFTLISYTSLYYSAGITSIFNATVPIFSAIVGYFWLKNKLSYIALAGIFIGFIGVFFISYSSNNALKAETDTPLILPTLAALLGTLSYGFTANYTQKHLKGIDSIAIASGAQFFALLCMLPLGYIFWPENANISSQAWSSVILLGVLSTAVAFLLFYHLIAEVGATNIVMVTYLIPLFAIGFGVVFLDELLTTKMYLGGLLILIGITLTTGIYKRLKLTKVKP